MNERASTLPKPIYLDYHATTPTDPRVASLMLHYMTEEFGNASSTDRRYECDQSPRLFLPILGIQGEGRSSAASSGWLVQYLIAIHSSKLCYTKRNDHRV
jgi:hypothetical protein